MYIFIVLYGLVLVYLICSEKVSFGSRVGPNIFGKGLEARMLLLMVMDAEYSAGPG